MPDAAAKPGTDFIRDIIKADRQAGKHGGRVHTRFPQPYDKKGFRGKRFSRLFKHGRSDKGSFQFVQIQP